MRHLRAGVRHELRVLHMGEIHGHVAWVGAPPAGHRDVIIREPVRDRGTSRVTSERSAGVEADHTFVVRELAAERVEPVRARLLPAAGGDRSS
ncbi:MAG: hypothetical protein R3F05_20335 [Planctomycetota bacterium]